ncbi:hypothetical protein TcWFU_010552 [Taenia crassiceps]|uniref:DUF5734 domain-containing protein n=1 Tax=Taenia crassiceps TaxID=6207 RepID=A0ABR4QTF2_9CEST
MSEYSLIHFHIGKYRQEAKINPQMNKELQKAAKAKPKEVIATISDNKVVFRNVKSVLTLADIAKLSKSSEHRIVMAATKVRKKHPGQIFVMRFSDAKKLSEFYNALDDVVRGEKRKKSEPTVSTPTPNPAPSEQPKRTLSSKSSKSELSSSDLSSTTVSSKITMTSVDENDSTTLLQTEKSISTLRSCLRSGYAPQQPSVQSQCGLRAASYVTTDALAKSRHSRSPKRKDRVSTGDVHSINAKAVIRRGKNNFEMNILKYVPGKGMVKSTKSNEYSHSTKKCSASTSGSFSSSSSSSSSTSSYSSLKSMTYTLRKRQHFRKVTDRASSLCSGSSNRSKSSLTSSIPINEKVNVWKYHSRAASNSSTLDGLTDRKQSRSRSTDYPRCPTCHQRTKYI